MATATATTVLDTPFHLITPLGLAEAYFFIEAGRDGAEWGCFQKDTGEFWIWPNKLVRLQKSFTEYRDAHSPTMLSDVQLRLRLNKSRTQKARLAPHLARTERARAE